MQTRPSRAGGPPRAARHQNSRRPPGRATHAVTSAARFVTALVALVVAVAGPPLLLRTLVGSPFDVPQALRTREALTSPVDDQTIVWLLALLAWLAWLHFLGTVTVEALNQIRGMHVRMPLSRLMFGGNQLLASHLVAALMIGGSATTVTGFSIAPATTVSSTTHHTSLGAPLLAYPAGLEAPPAAQPYMPQSPPPRDVGSPRAPDPVECRVLPPDGRHHDTLWDIAERHLGDGMRWREIFALNEGRAMPDGERLTRASLIRPGWILRLPADAHMLAADAVPTREHEEVTAPLDVAPAPAEAHPAEAQPAEAQPVEAEATQAAPDAEVAVPRPAAPQAPEDRPSVHAPGAQSLQAAPPIATPTMPGKPTPAAPRTAVDAPSDTQMQTAVATGLLGLAATGLLTALARRRKIAARRRPPGTRAATPAQELLLEEAALRREARNAQDITAAVRLTMLLAARTDPTLHTAAVWHHPDDSLELVLRTTAHEVGQSGDVDAPSGTMPPAPSPFTATERGWLLPATARRFLFATSRSTTVSARLDEQLQQQTDPCPVLLPVGTQDGSTCLVNLERPGLVSLVPAAGDPSVGQEDRPAVAEEGDLAAILIGWAQQLAAAPWFELSRVLLAPRYADGVAGSTRIDVLTPQDLVTLRTAAHAAPEDTAAAETSTSGPDRSDAWDGIATAPDVLLGIDADDVPREVLTAAADPRQPICAVLTTAHPLAETWTLLADGTVRIPGIAAHLTPTRLSAERLARIRALLEHAQDPPHAAADDPGALARDNHNPPTPFRPRLAVPLTAAGPEPVVETPHEPLPSEDAVGVIDLTRRSAPSPSAPPAANTDGGDGDESRHSGDQPEDPAAAAPADTSSGQATPTTASARGLADPTLEPESAPSAGEPSSVEDQTREVRIDVLGPISITGTRVTLGDTLRQLAVYLALHRRPVQPRALWEAVNPDREFNDHALRTRLNELNRYLWQQLEKDGRARMLAHTVRCDWQEFRALAAGDDTDKMTALSLVRGRPFEDFQPDWVYLEGYATDLEAAIVDLALDVATRALARGDNATASLAAAAGLKASPYEERLAQLGIRAASHRGAHHLARALHRQLSAVLDEEIAPEDSEQPDTTALMRTVTDLATADRNRTRQD